MSHNKDNGDLTKNQIKELENNNVLVIDGSKGEGGGQVLRISIALAAILQRKVMIYKIRENRSKPGLRAQHLEGIKLVSKLHQGILENDNLYSRKIYFEPKEYLSQNGIIADPKTAGSICLLIQVVLPTLLYGNCDSVVELRGGTNASMAPQIDYLIRVLKPILNIMGISFDIKIEKRGYFPKGGGVVKLFTNPIKSIKPITLLERGNIQSTTIRAFVARVDRSDAVKMFTTTKKEILKVLPNHSINEEIVIETKCIGAGKGLICVTKTENNSYIGGSAIANSPKESPIKLGKIAAKDITKVWENSSCTDEYLQDQLIIFMALANGKSQIRTGELSLHTSTAISIVSQFLGDIFTTQKQDDGSYIIECNGIGYMNKYLTD